MKKVFCILTLLLLACLLVACGGKDEQTTISSISVTGLKSTYTQNEEVDYSNAVLVVTYSDGSKKTVALDPQWITGGVNTLSIGKKTLSGSYNNYTFSYTYTVEAATIVSRIRSVTVEGLSTSYKMGDRLSLNGATLIVVIDGEAEPLSISLTQNMVSGFDTSRAGEKTLKITAETTFGTASCEVTYTVAERNIIDVTPAATGLSFYKNDTVDALLAALAKCPFTISYSDETTAQVTVTSASSVTGFDTSKLGEDFALTVKVVDQDGRGKTVTLTYKVKERYNEQKVTFVSNGYSFDKMTEDGYVQAQELTMRGYLLEGWYTDQNKKFSFDTRLSAPLTLTAHWEPITYTALLYNNGALDKEVTYTVESSMSLPYTPRNGYIFDTYVDAKGNSIKVLPRDLPKELLDQAIDTDEPISLYGHWDSEEYTVEFDLNDDDSPSKATHDNPAIYTIDTSKSLAPATRNGYTFEGWTDVASNKTVTTLNGLWGARTLKANWGKIRFAVTFVNGITSEALDLDSVYYYTSDSNTKLPVPQVEGYSFEGWYYDNGAKVQTDRDGDQIIPFGSFGDKVLTAKLVKAYTILVDLADGSEVQTIQFTPTSTSVTLPMIERFGYDFVEYLVDGQSAGLVPQDGTIRLFGKEARALDGKTLTAKWLEHQHTITYYYRYNRPASEEELTETQTFGAATDAPLVAPERKGYRFVGWYTNESLSSTRYAEVLRGGTFDKDIKLYAYWQVETYTITVHFNLAEELVDPVDMPAGYRITAPVDLPTPTAKYHAFAGWYLDEGYTQRITVIENRSGDLDLYADWAETQFVPTVYDQGGAAFSGDYTLPTYTCSSTDSIPLGTPKRKGYTFVGWYLDEACAGAKQTTFAPQNHLDEPLVLYAKWSLDTYTVTYQFVDEEGNTLSSVTNGNKTSYTVEDHVALQDPSRNGYRFVEWTVGGRAVESTEGFAEKLIVVGNFAKGTYTIEYDQDSILAYLDQATIAALPTEYQLGGDLIKVSNTQNGFQDNLQSKITRLGYYLKGLHLESAPTTMLTQLGATSVAANSPACQDVKLYASWTAITFNFTYKYLKSDAGSWGTLTVANAYKSTTTQAIVSNQNGFALPDPTAVNNTLTGLGFRGWYPTDGEYDEDGFSALTMDGLADLTFANTASVSITLYTRLLDPVDYTITYVLPQGASNPPETPTTYQYAKTGNNLPTPTEDGCKFVGWYLDAEHTQKITNLNSRTGDVTIYAYFEYILTLSVHLNGGTSSANFPETYTADTAIDLSKKTITPPSGHTFVGWWYQEGACILADKIIPTGLTGETVTVYAMFQDGTSTLSLNVASDHVTVTKPKTISSTTTLPTYVGGTELSIPVTEIEGSAFNGAAITTLNWAPLGKVCTITTIGTYAFYQAKMTTLTLPASLVTIGTGAFEGLPNVTSITINAPIGKSVLSSTHEVAVVLHTEVADGALKNLKAVTELTAIGGKSLASIFESNSNVPATLTTLHLTGAGIANAMLAGSQVTTVYLDGIMVNETSFAVLSNNAKTREVLVTVKVPGALLTDYEEAYGTYLGEGNYLALVAA